MKSVADAIMEDETANPEGSETLVEFQSELGDRGARAAHLRWCKARALEYLPGDPVSAVGSMLSDLGKHPETATHAAIELGGMLLLGGHLNNPGEARKFIEGFN